MIYGLTSEARFREEFDHAFGEPLHASQTRAPELMEAGLKPQVYLSFSSPPADVADRYAARSSDDVYLTVQPREALAAAEQERVISAVQTAARAAGTSCEQAVLGVAATADGRDSLSRPMKLGLSSGPADGADGQTLG